MHQNSLLIHRVSRYSNLDLVLANEINEKHFNVMIGYYWHNYSYDNGLYLRLVCKMLKLDFLFCKNIWKVVQTFSTEVDNCLTDFCPLIYDATIWTEFNWNNKILDQFSWAECEASMQQGRVLAWNKPIHLSNWQLEAELIQEGSCEREKNVLLREDCFGP